MTPLRELQGALRAGILSDNAAPLAGLIQADGLTPEGQLQIYRNNTFISLSAALRATFPVVCRLVGEGFFGYAADAYIRERPPTAPCLAEFGADFADFLAGFPPAQSLAYLPDAARLEWALNDAYHAADAPPLDARRIAAVPQALYPGLVFELHPACRLLASAFPIDRIWRANQPEAGDDGAIDLGAGGCRLLVHRRDDDVRFRPLSAAGFALLGALGDGATLQAAFEAATAADAAFDLAAALQEHLRHGVFTEFRIPSASGAKA